MVMKALPAVPLEAEKTTDAVRKEEVQVQDTIHGTGEWTGNAAEQPAEDPVLPL